jgi:hypothetical protein
MPTAGVKTVERINGGGSRTHRGDPDGLPRTGTAAVPAYPAVRRSAPWITFIALT